MDLKPHPLDNTLIQYINAAEDAGYEWEISGGRMSKESSVVLHHAIDRTVYSTDSQPNYAFHSALKKAGVIRE